MDRAEGLPHFATGCKQVKRPRQNRVTPFGKIEVTHHKGGLMGNRGDLHAQDGTLGRQWRSTRWLSCILDGGGWKAPMDEPGRNYPLFFHDEAVALAAGHRPCGQCRPDALAAFIKAWKVGHGLKPSDWLPLSEIDRQLHRARLAELRRRRRVDANSLPSGVFVWCPAVEARPLIKVGGKVCGWSHGGYGPMVELANTFQPVYQLTCTPMIAVIQSGYQPLSHRELQLVV